MHAQHASWGAAGSALPYLPGSNSLLVFAADQLDDFGQG